MDSITGQQNPAQRQKRHRDNLITIQENLVNQLRDINAGLETLQQQHPTLDLAGLFGSVHALDSNHRAVLDLAKEAAGVPSDEVPAPPRLINVSTLPAGEAAPRPFTHISIDQTEQPAGNNPALNPGSVRHHSPDLAPADEGTQPNTQPNRNTIVTDTGTAQG
jgi:hypothetical protein